MTWTWRGQPEAEPPIPPNVALLRSVRAGGDTKIRKSRRALILPQRVIDAFEALWETRTCGHAEMSECACLVFVTRTGKALEAHNVRRNFRKIVDALGWSEGNGRRVSCGRASFRYQFSDAQVPLEVISRLVGHRSTIVTETVYRKQLRPVIEGGADVMNRIFPKPDERGHRR